MNLESLTDAELERDKERLLKKGDVGMFGFRDADWLCAIIKEQDRRKEPKP